MVEILYFHFRRSRLDSWLGNRYMKKKKKSSIVCPPGKWAPSLCRRFEGSKPLSSLLHCWRGETVRGSLGERSLGGFPTPSAP